VGQHDPLGTGVVTRVQTYDAVGFPDGNDHGMPGVETFGFSVGYRFNPFWHIKAQTTRQRVSFVEYLNKDYATHALYYNAMWHTDVMAEYNLLPYGLSEGGARVRKFTPYLGFGLGVTVFNKDAQLRHINGKSGPKNDFAGTGCYYTCYPRVGQQQIYDANGNLIKSEFKTPDGDHVYTYTYNDEGNLVNEHGTALNEYWYNIDYTYNADGQLMQKVYTDNEEDSYTADYAYDNAGNCIKEETSYSNGEKEVFTREYDANGNVTKEMLTASDGSVTSVEWQYALTYLTVDVPLATMNQVLGLFDII
jgi:YD repeat-containing protein